MSAAAFTSVRLRADHHLKSVSLAFLLFLTISLLLLIFVVMPVHAADSTKTISDDATGGDCASIGSWDQATKTCTLGQDLTTEGVNAINIISDGIILEGNGHTLTGNGTGIGVSVTGHANVSVSNLQVASFETGVSFNGVTNGQISNITLTTSLLSGNFTGILLTGASTGNVVQSNSISVSLLGSVGISLAGASSSNIIAANTVTLLDYGIYVAAGSNSNDFVYNTMSLNVIGGLTIANSNNNEIFNNNFLANVLYQARVSGTSSGNAFNRPLPLGGNHWSLWILPDLNFDGIVDLPYNDILNGVTDPLPWVAANGFPNESSPPLLSDFQPTGTIHASDLTIKASFIDGSPSRGINGASATVTLNGGAPIPCTTVGNPGGSINCTVTGLTGGAYNAHISLSDNAGNIGTLDGSFLTGAYEIWDDTTGGDCTLIGDWDNTAKTCTLNADLNISSTTLNGIEIMSNNVTLDGGGYSITGPGIPLLTKAVYLPARTGVTVQNLHVADNSWADGIYLQDGTGNTVTGNTLGTGTHGIFLAAGSDGNDISSNTLASELHLEGADGNSLILNTINGTQGFYLSSSSLNTLAGNTFNGGTGASMGFIATGSNNNLVENNIFTRSSSDNQGYGIDLITLSSNNSFHANQISNFAYGFSVGLLNTGNEFYNNSFTDNTNYENLTLGNTFNRAAPTGGNYWDIYHLPGQGCNNVDPQDNFCDAPLDVGVGQDQLPWTLSSGWSTYHFTWYDNQDAFNWVLLANPSAPSGNSDLSYNLSIQGTARDLTPFGGPVANPGEILLPRLPGVRGGPVVSASMTGAAGIVTQRSLWDGGNSMEEVPGIQSTRLSSHYYWTWYDNRSPGMLNWVLVANPEDSPGPVYYEITIDGQIPATSVDGSPTGVLQPGEMVTPRFPTAMGGPVEVNAWTSDSKSARANVMASQRVLSNYNTPTEAFNELPGTPVEELGNDYLWTWYDNTTPGAYNWVLVANPDNVNPLYYEITIANQPIPPELLIEGASSGTIDPGSMSNSRFAMLAGPVEVRTWTDSGKGTPKTSIASQRSIWGPSFGEVPGFARTALADDYHWTWYDEVDPGTFNWVLISNTNSQSIYYEITVAGAPAGPVVEGAASGTIAANSQANARFAQRGGPVEVKTWTDATKTTPINVLASQRVLWHGYYNEVLGIDLD